MIIKTAVNGHAGNLYRHLIRTDDGNERIRLLEVRGCAADDLLGSLREMKATAAGSRCEKSLYHASFAAPHADSEQLQSDALWLHCADRLEKEFGLEGHARAIVHHYKDGRWHQHVVWNRIDPDTGRAAHLAHDHRRAIKVARELERDLKLTNVPSERPKHRKQQRPPVQWEKEAARRTKIDADLVRDQIAETWTLTGNGREYAAALEARGLLLAKGDVRPYVVLDGAGNFYALSGRVLPGENAKSIRGKLADVERDLPTLAQARAIQAERELAKRHKRGSGTGGGQGSGGGPQPQAQGDGIDQRYRDEHAKLNKQRAADLKAVETQIRQLERQQREEVKRFEAKPPRIGKLDKLLRRDKAKLAKWEKEKAAMLDAQEKKHAALVARRADIEARAKSEAGVLRERERQEKANRKTFNEVAERPPQIEKLEWFEDNQPKHKRTPGHRLD